LFWFFILRQKLSLIQAKIITSNSILLFRCKIIRIFKCYLIIVLINIDMKNITLLLASFAIMNFAMAQNKIFVANGEQFEMVLVGGGRFAKGDPAAPENAVVGSFYIGQTEVTQNLWKAVMGKKSSSMSRSKTYPADQISWADCQEFISKLNQITGAKFRMPTETEWEFAARGGNMTHNYKLSGGAAMGKIGWYNGNSNGESHPVAAKTANELGIFDMSGNLWEWCADDYGNGISSYKSDICGLRLALDL